MTVVKMLKIQCFWQFRFLHNVPPIKVMVAKIHISCSVQRYGPKCIWSQYEASAALIKWSGHFPKWSILVWSSPLLFPQEVLLNFPLWRLVLHYLHWNCVIRKGFTNCQCEQKEWLQHSLFISSYLTDMKNTLWTLKCS